MTKTNRDFLEHVKWSYKDYEKAKKELSRKSNIMQMSLCSARSQKQLQELEETRDLREFFT
jgi:hypothetical protein